MASSSSRPRNPINTADPRNRKLIIDLYEERGETYIKAEFGVSRFAICRWKSLQLKSGSLGPRFEQRGRKSKVSPADVRRMERALLKNPFATNRDLAAVIGNKISPQAAGKYIRISELRFVKKLEQLDVESSFTQEHVQKGLEYLGEIESVPFSKRVYVDETWIGAGVRRRFGRFPSGTVPHTPRNRKYPRKTVVGAIRQHGFIGPSRILNKGVVSTPDFEDYVRRDLAPKLKRGDAVIWDQLGKSGRAKNPTATHFSPIARALIEARGARLVLLPPAGKHHNPIECVFGETKRLYELEVRRLTRVRNASSLTFKQLSSAWRKAEGLVSLATFGHAFSQRATGVEFNRVCEEKGLV